METMYAALALLLVLALTLAILRGHRARSGHNDDATPLPSVLDAKKLYSPRTFFFSVVERKFYEALRFAVGNDYVVMAKVRLIDLVDVTAGGRDAATARNQVSQKHVDFVLLSPGYYQPLAVIELDDASHEREPKASRDELVDAVLAQAALPCLRCSVAGKRWDPPTLRSLIRTRLGVPAKLAGTIEAPPEATGDMDEEEPAMPAPAQAPARTHEPPEQIARPTAAPRTQDVRLTHTAQAIPTLPSRRERRK
ncbi:MAG: DUF2726 domain-containing protein [Bacillota bacterium]